MRGPCKRQYKTVFSLGGEMAVPGTESPLAEHRAFVRRLLKLYPDAQAKIVSVPNDAKNEPREVLSIATWERNNDAGTPG